MRQEELYVVLINLSHLRLWEISRDTHTLTSENHAHKASVEGVKRRTEAFRLLEEQKNAALYSDVDITDR